MAINPVVNQDFVFVDNLEPGTHMFWTARSIATAINGIATRNANDFRLDRPISLKIHTGEIYIPDEKVEVVQIDTERNKWRTIFKTVKLTQEERQAYVAKLQKLENAGTWQITVE